MPGILIHDLQPDESLSLQVFARTVLVLPQYLKVSQRWCPCGADEGYKRLRTRVYHWLLKYRTYMLGLSFEFRVS